MLMALADHGAAAAGSGPRWMHIEVGAGYAAGSIARMDNVGALSATLGMSHSLARELRSTFEIGYFRTGAQGPGTHIPEFEVTTDPSNIAATLIGLELYGPIRGGSGPFVSEAFGLGFLMPGTSHEKYLSNGQWLTFDSRGRFELGPAISLAAGFRRMPKQGGLAPRANI